MSQLPISAYVITYNNDRTLEKALKSLCPWVSEIVVVDSRSTDDTVAIARRYATRFEQRPWPGFRDQYQYAADLCTNNWLMFIDADEEISPELAAEIQEELPRNLARPEAAQVHGYYGHRRTYYLGRWIMHGGWVPDYEIRLYHRRFGRWKGDLHANVHIDGKVAHLRGFYYHYTYADISDQLKTIDRYSATAASDMHRSGRRFSWLHLVGNPLFRFLRDYVLKLGFLDGTSGLIVAANSMFYVFNKHAKLWELENRVSSGGGLPENDERPQSD